MAASTKHIELEISMDENVARLEAKTDHIQSDVTDIKAELRRVEAKVDSKVDALNTKIDTLYGALKDAIAAQRLEMKEGFAAIRRAQLLDRIWWLIISGGILGIMARGMKWL